MDLLNEHVHVNVVPIQGSGGATNNFSWLTNAGEEKIASYEEHHTTSDMSRRLRGASRALDPLEHLPPELSTFVITQALPLQGITSSTSIYQSRLIELTTVSRKWQSLLFSTPVLWSELHIDERQEDFLATLSVFVRLSSSTPVKVFFYGKPDRVHWQELTSVLLSAAKRVTCLNFSSYNFKWVLIALSNFLERLCGLPQLKEVNFTTDDWDWVSLLQIKSLGLPPSIRFSGLFLTQLPESCRKSGTSRRFFDVTKCTTLGTLGRLVPPSQPDLLLFKYRTDLVVTNIISKDATILQLESLAERLAECNCFEQVVHRAALTLQRLQVGIDLSQTDDLIDCLQMLMQLQSLELDIRRGDSTITRDHTLSDMTSRDLRKFTLKLIGGVEDLDEAQKPLSDLFSALGTLYPGVEEVRLDGSTWIGLEDSYLQILRALKSLVLAFEGSPLALSSGPITLQSLQFLEMHGVPHLNNLLSTSLLKLVLKLGSDVTVLEQLGPFPRGLRSLTISLEDDMKDFNLTSLDCPGLRDLHLLSWARRASWGCPWLLNLVSIRVGSDFRRCIDPSSNQLCIALLCYPWRLPSLQKLHFATCVEWDILFLMLKRRNCDRSGVQRIDTVTLPFIPFAFRQLLSRLLAGEIVELPSLTSLSLEATREVIFDPSVPGCAACMKNMRPGCMQRVAPTGERDVVLADILYPPDDPILEEAPRDIRDWLSQRRELVKMWKASYEEFALKFSRAETCAAFPHVLP